MENILEKSDDEDSFNEKLGPLTKVTDDNKNSSSGRKEVKPKIRMKLKGFIREDM